MFHLGSCQSVSVKLSALMCLRVGWSHAAIQSGLTLWAALPSSPSHSTWVGSGQTENAFSLRFPYSEAPEAQSGARGAALLAGMAAGAARRSRCRRAGRVRDLVRGRWRCWKRDHASRLRGCGTVPCPCNRPLMGCFWERRVLSWAGMEGPRRSKMGQGGQAPRKAPGCVAELLLLVPSRLRGRAMGLGAGGVRGWGLGVFACFPGG